MNLESHTVFNGTNQGTPNWANIHYWKAFNRFVTLIPKRCFFR